MREDCKTPSAGRYQFQFSIRWLLIFTAMVAVLMAVGVCVYRERDVE